MSYDLSFRKPQAAPFTREQFSEYFANRPNYQVTNDQALYENKDTGVYFLFEYQSDSPDSPKQNGVQAPVMFNLNYYRPHIFGLEAEPEVAAFIKHFNLLIEDTQAHGMGNGEYSREGFLRGWNHGNDFGYHAILTGKNAPSEVHTLPTRAIEGYWRWNITRNAFQRELGDGIFVPRIMFTTTSGSPEPKSFVAWPDAIPVTLPKVDLIVAPRKELAPTHWFQKKQDMVLFHWGDLEALLKDFLLEERSLPFYRLEYHTAPSSVLRLFKTAQPISEKPAGVAVDSILDAELVEKHLPGKRPRP